MASTDARKKLLPVICFGFMLILTALAWHSSRGHSLSSTSIRQVDRPFKYTNHLIDETSPYLLEHAHNPVNWYPWGSEALDRARREHRPIFLSVGYSACHWCHVMAHQDFENEEIAKILNDHFISIKVDREQRPDIDQQYLLAVQLMTGEGGWPLSVFLTPDRKPFYGGTYFPPDEFKKVLGQILEQYRAQPSRIQDMADRVAATVAADTKPPAATGTLSGSILRQAETDIAARYDRRNGGFSQMPKFPEAPTLTFLISRYKVTHSPVPLQMVTHTLDEMAAGGIYDQLGGGFHRYSTDTEWRIPHFEKMLYDQAQLAIIYLDAFQITRNTRYREVAKQTLAFVYREMRDPVGGFYSSIDADSEGQEGRFYLWTTDQVKTVLMQDASLFDTLYGVTDHGDLDGKNVLHQAETITQATQVDTLSPLAREQRVLDLRIRMLNARNDRERPKVDDKVLASWNGLMIAAYAHAYQLLGDPAYLQAASSAADFLADKMTRQGLLQHAYHAGRTEMPALLEDDAFVMYGLLALYDTTHERRRLDAALNIAHDMIHRFADTENGGFYSTAGQGDLLAHVKSAEDTATSSASGIAAQVFQRLSIITHDSYWKLHAARDTAVFQPLLARSPSSFPTLLIAYQGADPALSDQNGQIVRLTASPLMIDRQGRFRTGIHVQIQNGWHINTDRPGADYLLPTRLRLASPASARLTTINYPTAHAATLGPQSSRLQVLEGSFVCKTEGYLPKPMRQIPIKVRFTLSYQACNARSCLTPTNAIVDTYAYLPSRSMRRRRPYRRAQGRARHYRR